MNEPIRQTLGLGLITVIVFLFAALLGAGFVGGGLTIAWIVSLF